MNEIIGQAISGLSLFIAFMVYERTKNKDNGTITTTLAILMTKVDTMLELNGRVNKVEEMLIRHDEEIKSLKDTNRFAKITDEMIRGGK